MPPAKDYSQAPALDIPLHVKYVQQLDENKDLAYHLTSHLRLNGVYWGLTALSVLGHADALSRDDMVDYVMACWDDEAGAFGAHVGHDAHMHATLSAIQILIMQDALDRCDVDRVVQFAVLLVGEDGSMAGDAFGERDTRFSYLLISALSLLGRLDDLNALYDGTGRQRVIDHLVGSMNFDGAFGSAPGAESHGAQGEPELARTALTEVWVSVASLAILGELHRVDSDLLGWWLAERQLANGGLNGRPEKLEDVCYSWWNLAALSIIGKLHWINRDKLIAFILSAQDLDGGGIADRPDDWVDVFHTVFGVAGLSLLGYPGLQDIHPLYCMPRDVIDKRGLGRAYQQLPRLAAWPPSASVPPHAEGPTQA
ncbi:Rab geranylgeranyltransferase [Vanrija albida]|uniref:Geranylgeranyl transferase type-2 subunit beta n=1 Tax=Vanrija albida TaxID=181172 RepID=A0ABR3Q1F8_9TREE